MVGDNLTEIQLQQLVDRTILQGDKDKDGKLNYKEFLDVCSPNPRTLECNLPQSQMIKDTHFEDKLRIAI